MEVDECVQLAQQSSLGVHSNAVIIYRPLTTAPPTPTVSPGTFFLSISPSLWHSFSQTESVAIPFRSEIAFVVTCCFLLPLCTRRFALLVHLPGLTVTVHLLLPALLLPVPLSPIFSIFGGLKIAAWFMYLRLLHESSVSCMITTQPPKLTGPTLPPPAPARDRSFFLSAFPIFRT